MASIEWCDRETLGSWEDFRMSADPIGDYLYVYFYYLYYDEDGDFQEHKIDEYLAPVELTVLDKYIELLQQYREEVKKVD